MDFRDRNIRKGWVDFVVRIYPAVFSVLILSLLLTFISKPGTASDEILTDFRWKNFLISQYSFFRYLVGDRVYNTALVGEDGWIFYTGGKSVQDYQKVNDLDEVVLEDLISRLGYLSKKLENEGRTLLVVIPPNKSTVYPQYMPDEIPVLGERSRFDRFIEAARMGGSINVLDLRPVLADASKNYPVYYKVDTHWNDFGAYYGYYEILSFLSGRDARLRPHPLSEYEYVYQGSLVNPDLPTALGIPVIKEEFWRLIPKFHQPKLKTLNVRLQGGGYITRVLGQDNDLPSLLVYHDSFYSAHLALSQFIEPHFSRTTGILVSSQPEIWSLDWIENENPDIVIVEIVERNFDGGLLLLLDSIKP